MSSSPSTIRRNKALSRVLAGRESADRGLSPTLTTIAVRYAEIVRRRARALGLSTDEWLCVCEALDGVLLLAEDCIDGWLWAQVQSEIAAKNLDVARLNVPALMRRLRSLDYVDAIAVLDVVERYWQSETADPRDALAELLEA